MLTTLLLALTASAWADPTTVPTSKTITIAAVGDTMMGTHTRKGPRGLAPGNGEGLFTGVNEIMSAADVAFLNLEGPLGDDIPVTKCGPNSKNCYAFITPTRYTAALTGLGIDMVSLANNHGFDAGERGMRATMDALDTVGIAHSGLPGEVAIVERNGLKIGMVATATSGCCININNIDHVKTAVQDLDKQVDVVVVSFHGGAEGSKHRHVPGKLEIAWGEKRGDVKALARAAIDAGADLVLGHGPHVLRAMEVYSDRLIVYSMGNFCGYNQFGTRGGYGGTSMVVEATLTETGALHAAKIHPLALDNLARPRPDPSGAAWAQVRELSAADFPETGVKIKEDGSLTWGDN